MNHKISKSRYGAMTMLGFLLLVAACASPGTPSGGPRDEDPPRFVRSSPMPGATGVSPQRVEIWFDEIVNVKDAFSKVVVSPTGAKTPRVTSLGRRIRVDFQDTLMPNTTYTIDFADAIEDNNEGNKLQGFTYTFSTGEILDSLQISGMVMNALTLEPQQSTLVGVYSAVNDTTFQKMRLERVAKTDDRGRFVLRGLGVGPYYLYALGDLNNDQRWDNPEEEIAFYGVPIYPTSTPVQVTDTVWNLVTGDVDSLYTRTRTSFLPNNILLNSFKVDRKPQYLVKNERMDSTRLSLVFNAPNATLPRLSLVNAPAGAADDWYVLQRNATSDTLTYWIRPGVVLHTDTLQVALGYDRLNAAGETEIVNDTLRMITKRPRPVKKKKGEAEKTEEKFLDMRMITSTSHEYYNPLIFEFNAPLATLDTKAFRLEEKVDTVWKPMSQGTPVPVDSLSLMRYKIEGKWDFGKEYRLVVDSLAAVDIYGLSSKPLTHSFKVKNEDEYSNLRLTVSGLVDSIPAFVELLNQQDQPVRREMVENGAVIFRYLTPATYYARLVEDMNGNGIYDSGDYEAGRQPEMAYYYPKALKLKTNWDVDQPWNIIEVPLDKQKPEAIKKNKPQRNKNDRSTNQQEEDEDDDTFDVSSNPFDPAGNKRKRQTGVRY